MGRANSEKVSKRSKKAENENTEASITNGTSIGNKENVVPNASGPSSNSIKATWSKKYRKQRSLLVLIAMISILYFIFDARVFSSYGDCNKSSNTMKYFTLPFWLDWKFPLKVLWWRILYQFRINERIAIVGAGPSGLAAAEALKQLGYKNVTVFEKEKKVGGKCSTVVLEGRPYEMGAVFAVFLNRYSKVKKTDCHEKLANINSYFRSIDHRYNDNTRYPQIPLLIRCSPGDSNGLLLAEINRGKKNTTKYHEDLPTKEQEKIDNLIDTNRVRSNVASSTESMVSYLKKHNLEETLFNVNLIFAYYGFGFADDPGMSNHYAQMMMYHLDGKKLKQYFLENGWQPLFKKLAKRIGGVQTAKEVMSLKRKWNGVTLTFENGISQEFDRVLLATPPKQALKILGADATPAEREGYNAVNNYYIYWIALAKIPNLDFIGALLSDTKTIEDGLNRLNAYTRFYKDSDITMLQMITDSAQTEEEVKKILIRDVKVLLGSHIANDEFLELKRWEYMPHVKPQTCGLRGVSRLHFLSQPNTLHSLSHFANLCTIYQ